ncbi:PCNA-interacting partner-like [Saccostrea echinata]|uniref:PCNA-interacting partner-like n=1 Tax=Saccostrea echinata TaxID=191078 RepID=UPI002A826C43|nr:PCNA-interacting partner-like [Saccostrea echinata]
MMVNEAGCFVLSCCDKEVVNKHLKSIQDHIQEHASGSSNPPLDTSVKKITVINCQDMVCEDAYSISEYFIFLCRKYQLLPNERSTLLSSMDQLIALQLCLAEKNKEERGEFDIETSTVFESNKEIIKAKLQSLNAVEPPEISESYHKFLQHCNYVDTCDVVNLVQKACTDDTCNDFNEDLSKNHFLFLGLPNDPVEIAMINLLCKDKAVHKVNIEVSLEEEGGDVNVCSTVSSMDSLISQRMKWRGIGTPGPSQSAVSINQMYVQLVFVAYLELLVNSRSELALARSFNVPERELGLSAFTDLKHESQKKNMPMYQTATSFIMRVRLGGKGYKPDPSLPISQHTKGLSDFITLTHKLQTIVEEEENTRVACRKVLNVLKKEISKSEDKRIQNSTVEKVCENLQRSAVQVLENIEINSPAKKSLGGTPLGYKTLRAIHHLVDKLVTGADVLKANSLDVLCDSFSNQHTPVRFPCLLSQFRTPCDDVDSPELNKSLAERLLEKQRKETPLHAKRYKATMDWAAPLHDVQMTDEAESFKCQKSTYVLPSKTLVQPASASKRVELPGLKERTSQESNKDKDVDSTSDLKEKPLSQESRQEETVSYGDDVENHLEVGGKARKRPGPEPCEKEPKKKKTQAQGKNCRRKLLPQIKGQQQINKFFRM